MAVAVCLVAQLPMIPAAHASPAKYHKGQLWTPPNTPKPTVTAVPRGRQQGGYSAPEPAAPGAPPYRAPAVHLPAAGSTAVPVAPPKLTAPPEVTGDSRPSLATYTPTRVGTSPIWVGTTDDSQAAPSTVRVTFSGVEPAHRALIQSGLMFGITRADEESGPGSVRVQLDTSALAGEFGGNYAQRLRLVRLPACAMSSPDSSRCQERTPLVSSYDLATGRLTTDVKLPGGAPAGSADSGGMLVLAADSVPAGSAGSYAATSVKPSDQWSVSGSGGFSYSYPIALPPALGGAAPKVALSYSSADVDGLTAADNAQASWVGSGWSFDPGYIERSYQPCADDGITGSGDTCWALSGYEVTLGGNGWGGRLVHNDADGTWHLATDSGAKITLLSGANNGAYNGEYWVITQQDGTRYYFGAGHLPAAEGGTGADPASNAAWTEPVYCPKSGDPCYSSTTGQNSYTPNMAYRWNLDYIVDPHGNAVTFSYGTETNYYARGSSHTNTSYVRGGYLSQINYGWLASDVAAQSTPAPAAKVVFTTGQRCTGSQTECSSYANLNSTTKADWPDTPYDLICTATSTCTNGGMSYFSTYMLTQIQTLVNTSSGYKPVDTYTLAHSFPSPGDSTSPSPWLDSITHTGNDASTAVSLPAVTFGGTMMANRVTGSGTYPDYNHQRITSISTETGEQVTVSYSNTTAQVAACNQSPTAPVLPSTSDNTMLCYQQYWTPPGQVTPTSDWFNKYVVTQVRGHDGVTYPTNVARTPDTVTTYRYVGTPAWHRDDSPLTKNSQRSWNQFRGFGQVDVQVGVAPDPITQTSTTYLRGMDGDYTSQTGGTQKSVTITDGLGDQIRDSDVYADMALESDVYSQADGTVQSRSVSLPWSAQTAVHAETSQTGLPAETANFVATGTSRVAELLTDGTWRQTKTVSTYSTSSGLLQYTDSQGDQSLVGTSDSQETCTSTQYATPPSSGQNAGMVAVPFRATTVSVTTEGPLGSAACPAPTPTNTISDTLAYYDGNTTTPGVIATVGDATQVTAIDHYDGTTPVYTTTTSGAFDGYGRATSTTDARGLTTTVAYTPSTGQLPTSTLSTNTDKGWTTTIALDQARQLPTKTTDLNGLVTSLKYDALGRLISVWLPGRVYPQSASIAYVYSVNGTSAPSWVESKKLRDDATYAVSYAIFDGSARQRQGQSIALDGSNGSVVTDTFYDSHGWTVKQTNPYFESSFPSSTIYPASDADVPGETTNGYDGRGRVTSSAFVSHAHTQWQTTTSYPGADRTDVVPPSGGTATSTFSDALGRTAARWSYTTATPTGVASDARVISYSYFPSGKLAKVTGPAGQVWTYGYDLHGNQTSATDPDAGSSSAKYSAAGDLLTTTDARNQQITYTYDTEGRREAKYAGDTSGTLLASWTYDSATLGKGMPASSTSYVGGASGTAYTKKITEYTNRGAVKGATVTIPADVGTELSPLAGTYSTSFTYTTIMGLPSTTGYGADGGLPTETVTARYNQNGVMNNLAGAADYMTSAIADPFGHNTTVYMGDMPYQVVQNNYYDQATGRLTEQILDKESASSHVDDVTTFWNLAGGVTASRDVQDGSSTDLQCYRYDQLGQLLDAWSDTGGTQAAASPSVPNIGGCTNTTPAAANLGGQSPYWQSYSYNTASNRTGMTEHALDGNSANDITHTYTYTGTTGTGGQPDAVQSVTNTGPSGTTVDSYTYDPAGNTHTRTIGSTGPNQTIDYNPSGRTAKVSDSTTGDTAEYTYDADGNLLLQRDTHGGTTTVTLYLGNGEQLILDEATSAVSGLRYYVAPGGPTEVRSSTGTLTYEYANAQGTGEVTIDAGSSQAQSRRYFTPYGQPRGSVPASWVDNRAFLNQPADPATGLNLLGARVYDPSAGHFLQRDPVIETKDPGQLGGYAYAGNHPTTGADPSGLTTCSLKDGPCSEPPTTPKGSNPPCDAACQKSESAQGGCQGTACPKDTTLSCQSSTADIRGSINGSYACPTDDTNVPYMSLGAAPANCSLVYSLVSYNPECGRYMNAQAGLYEWKALSCLSGLLGLNNSLACQLMNHYLDATGADFNVDVNQLLGTPEFGGAVGDSMAEVKARAVAMCGSPPCTYTFDTGWDDMTFDKTKSEREFYAYRGMTYQVTGSVTVSRDANGNLVTSGEYSVKAYKAWNFDRNEVLNGVPFAGAADAAGYGMAHEFAVVGISSHQTW